MSNAIFKVPLPQNEPVLPYAPGTAPRQALKAALGEMASREIEIPLTIGEQVIQTGQLHDMRMPHCHKHLLGRYHAAGREHVAMAVDAAKKAQPAWAAMPWEERATIFLRAAEMLAGPYRPTMNAATMLCQSKTAHQAEIDSACELIDFHRFNVHFMRQLYEMQPESSPGTWNRLEYRPLEGYVLAVTPFNFAAIAGNLPMAAALMGNVVLWKPASSAVYTAYHIQKLWEAAGLPPGVITMLPGPASAIGDPLVDNPELAGVHFTGSTATFHHIWKRVGNNIASYRQYPRLVGETGGKDFVMAHASAEAEELATALVRGSFEYQGQKCSAASRAYIPDNLWPKVREHMLEQISRIRVGDVRDFENYMGAVIDRESFGRIKDYIGYARSAARVEVLLEGRLDDSEGWFVGPWVLRADDPQDRLMAEEIFGPVLTVHVYPEKAYQEMLEVCDSTSPYALTGAVFARERQAVLQAHKTLRHAAGNFYVNDKPTGAVVGQQPFGGARASGTNDKAGSFLNLIRWVSPRVIKETFVAPTDFVYPFLSPDVEARPLEVARH